MAVGEGEGEEVHEEVTSAPKNVGGKEAEADVELQPWEQHFSVIIIPQYDYKAPSSLLHHSHSGFLSLALLDLYLRVQQKKQSLSVKRWCHRIFPNQVTCILGEKELSSVVSSLVREYVHSQEIEPTTPLKFAVGYNRRGIDQKELKLVKAGSGDDAAILDRDKCFSIAFSAVKNVLPNVVADLKSPELCIIVECIPFLEFKPIQ